MQLEQRVADFIQNMQGNPSVNTLSAYRTDLGQLVTFMDGRSRRDWSTVTYDDLLAFQVFLRERRYADSTIARRTAAVRSFFAFMEQQGHIATNPMAQIDAPKVTPTPPRPLTTNQVDELLELPLRNPTPERRRDRAMLELLYATGMQVSELIVLNVTSVDLAAGTVTCTGTGARARTLPLGEAASTALEEYLDNARPHLARGAAQGNEALFLNHRGARLSRQGLWLILQGYAEELGIAELSPRSLRTTFAAHQLQNGAPIDDVRQRLGHAARTTTQHYANRPAK